MWLIKAFEMSSCRCYYTEKENPIAILSFQLMKNEVVFHKTGRIKQSLYLATFNQWFNIIKWTTIHYDTDVEKGEVDNKAGESLSANPIIYSLLSLQFKQPKNPPPI